MSSKPTYEELEARARALEDKITELNQVVQTLQETADQLQTVLFSLPVGIVVVDAATRYILEANPKAILMLNAPLEQMVNSTCDRFLCQPEGGNCPLASEGQRIHAAERTLTTADGLQLPIHHIVIPITLRGRSCLIECFIDIGEQKQSERERLQNEKMQTIMQMAGDVCHEMNQPLMAICGYSQLLAMRLKDDDPIKDKVDKILGQAERMAQITRKLMRIAQCQTQDYLQSKIIAGDKPSTL